MIDTLLLQAANGGGQWTNLIMIGGMIAIFYLFFIRPQQKKQKEQKKFVEAVKKGDKVITMGGIHGKIVSIDGNEVTLDVDRGTKIKFDKNSISFEMSSQENN